MHNADGDMETLLDMFNPGDREVIPPSAGSSVVADDVGLLRAGASHGERRNLHGPRDVAKLRGDAAPLQVLRVPLPQRDGAAELLRVTRSAKRAWLSGRLRELQGRFLRERVWNRRHGDDQRHLRRAALQVLHHRHGPFVHCSVSRCHSA